MVSFDEACLFSALEGEAKFWITLYLDGIIEKDGNETKPSKGQLLSTMVILVDLLVESGIYPDGINYSMIDSIFIKIFDVLVLLRTRQ